MASLNASWREPERGRSWRAFFAGVHDHAGACPDGFGRATETSSKWRLRCDKGLRDPLIHLDAADELRIDGLFIRPPADP